MTSENTTHDTQTIGEGTHEESVVAEANEAGVTPGDALRALPAEAQQRGSKYISAQAMQARLFSVYDAAAAAESALALVQNQLTLTLNRSYYEADEIEATAAELDALLSEAPGTGLAEVGPGHVVRGVGATGLAPGPPGVTAAGGRSPNRRRRAGTGSGRAGGRGRTARTRRPPG